MCEKIDRDLTSPTCKKLREHLKSCPECAAHYDSLKKTIILYKNYDIEYKGSCCKEVLARLEVEPQIKIILPKNLRSKSSRRHTRGWIPVSFFASYLRQKMENKMTKNIGTPDKWIRVIIGLFLLSLIFWGPETLWGLVGIIPIVTVFINFCPLYGILGLSTRRQQQKTA